MSHILAQNSAIGEATSLVISDDFNAAITHIHKNNIPKT